MQAEEQNRVFRDWLESHRGLLFKVVTAYAFSATDRDDLFQEISLQVWRSVPGFRGDCTVKTWIYRVALNAAIVWARQQTRHIRGRQVLEDNQPVLTPLETLRDTRLEWLYGKISELDEIDRSLTLLFLDGLSYREMAETLGLSESNVGTRIHRIKSRLARQSGEDGANDLR